MHGEISVCGARGSGGSEFRIEKVISKVRTWLQRKRYAYEKPTQNSIYIISRFL